MGFSLLDTGFWFSSILIGLERRFRFLKMNFLSLKGLMLLMRRFLSWKTGFFMFIGMFLFLGVVADGAGR